MKKFKLVTTFCLLFIVAGCSDNKDSDLLSLMTESPTKIVESNLKEISDGMDIVNLSIMVNDDGKYGDMQFGSHVVERKLFITRGNLGYFMDIWANLTLEKANLVYTNLTKEYGSAKEIKLDSNQTRWRNGTKVLQQFEIVTDGMLISLQLTVTEDKVYQMSASYTQAKD